MQDQILDSTESSKNFIYAGFGRRFVAYLIDIIPLVIVTYVVFYFIIGPELFSEENIRVNMEINTVGDVPLRVVVRYFSVILWIVYCTIMESSTLQATYGKKIMGIKVTDNDGSRISIGQSIFRNAFKIVSYVVLALGFLWTLVNKKKKGWHDMVAGTLVVKK